MHLKIQSAKWQPFYVGLGVLTPGDVTNVYHAISDLDCVLTNLIKSNVYLTSVRITELKSVKMLATVCCFACNCRLRYQHHFAPSYDDLSLCKQLLWQVQCIPYINGKHVYSIGFGIWNTAFWSLRTPGANHSYILADDACICTYWQTWENHRVSSWHMNMMTSWLGNAFRIFVLN